LNRFLSYEVDALAFGLGNDGKTLVQLRRDAQVELPGKAAAWLDTFFVTKLEESLQRLPELGAQFLRVLAVAPQFRPRISPRKRSSSGPYSILAWYPSTVMIPMELLRAARATCESLATAPLSVFGEGCGRRSAEK